MNHMVICELDAKMEVRRGEEDEFNNDWEHKSSHTIQAVYEDENLSERELS